MQVAHPIVSCVSLSHHCLDDAVFQRVIELIEASSSKHFQADPNTGDATKAHDSINLVAHRVVHGGSQTVPMVLWPGHDEGLEMLDKLSEFAPLHVGHSHSLHRQRLIWDSFFSESQSRPGSEVYVHLPRNPPFILNHNSWSLPNSLSRTPPIIEANTSIRYPISSDNSSTYSYLSDP